jgi:uncharacterized protein YjlB
MEKTSTSAKTSPLVHKFYLKDDGRFPNSAMPVLYYPGALKVPYFFAAMHVKKFFARNDWRNAWKAGIFTFHHYHSITHEVLGIVSGETKIQLGGEKGITLRIRKGDVLVLPAGVAHKNLGEEDAVVCIGAYPQGKNYDMNYGKAGERPQADVNIRSVPKPATDPIFGKDNGVPLLWNARTKHYYFKKKESSDRGTGRPKSRQDRNKESQAE